MGYLAHWYTTAMQHPNDLLWTSFGFIGAAVFGVRFLIQWISSEKEGHSVIPITFWYCSLAGGLISVLYAVHQQAWPLVLQQTIPVPIYARNIWMVYRDRRRTAAAA
jgi:lipid-A-disaccharide synthase-like uncharacterized protein